MNKEYPSSSAAGERPYRPRVLKGATILGAPTDSEIPCTIRNMHDGGAELTVPLEAIVAGTFLLYVRADGVAYRCRMRWREGKRVGVSFHGTEPKPTWHYG
jgi:hypothetical protein